MVKLRCIKECDDVLIFSDNPHICYVNDIYLEDLAYNDDIINDYKLDIERNISISSLDGNFIGYYERKNFVVLSEYRNQRLREILDI